MEWKKDTVDTFKAGNPDTTVTGIAVTMMATMDVLQRASSKGLNFVITHEPTFYAHLDTPEGLPENDAVWAEKRAFIEKHGMVVWRFHDHWHMRKPDGIEAGVVRTLGWEKFQTPDNQYLFVMPETTLRQLAGDVATRLGSSVVRVVGDPNMKVDPSRPQSGSGRLPTGNACPGTRRCAGVTRGGDARVGNRGVRRRCGNRRPQESADRYRAHSQRTAGDGGMFAMAEGIC